MECRGDQNQIEEEMEKHQKPLTVFQTNKDIYHHLLNCKNIVTDIPLCIKANANYF